MTRRTRNSVQPLYSVGEIVAVSQRYKDAGVNFLPEEDEEFGCYGFPAVQTPGWTNKMFVRADLMPHHIQIVSVKSERMQDISDEDCMKEGIHWWTKDNSLFKYDLGEGFEMFKWRDKPKNPREAFLRHRLKYERAYKLEINQLKHEITDLQQTSAYIYEQWFKDLNEREEKYNKLLDKLYQLEHPEEYENS